MSDEDEEANEIIQYGSQDPLQNVDFQTSSPTTYAPEEIKINMTKEKEEKQRKDERKQCKN